MDILCNKVIILWLDYIKDLGKSKCSIVTSLRYVSIIFYVIYLRFFEKKILLMLAKETIYRVAYKLNLEVYSVQKNRKFLIQGD